MPEQQAVETKRDARAGVAAGPREGAAWRFRGGRRLSLPGAPSGGIEAAAVPDAVTIACPDCKATVEKGAAVARGQVIARPEGGEDARPASPFHASVSGKVEDVREEETEDGGVVSVITIRREGDDTPKALEPADVSGADAREMLARLYESGVAALVPGGIPTGKGGSVAEGVPVKHLVVPLIAPEPFLPDPLVTIRERAADFAQGLRLLAKALGGPAVCLAGTPEALEVVRALGLGPAELHGIKAVHPAGSELMLAWLALGKPAALPLRAVQAGVVVADAQAVIAARDALVKGIAVTERVVALACGDNPRFARARVGTRVAGLLGAPRVARGGLLSGTLAGEGASLGRGDSALAALPGSDAAPARPKACISCGACADVCPTRLFPQMLARLAPKELYEEAEGLGLDRCVECGLCTFACPSGIDCAGAIRELKRGLAEERESE